MKENTANDKLKEAEKLTYTELKSTLASAGAIRAICRDILTADDYSDLEALLSEYYHRHLSSRNSKELPLADMVMTSARIFSEMIDPDRNIIVAMLLQPLHRFGLQSDSDISSRWGDDVLGLISGIEAVRRYSSRNNATNHDNFRGLMVALAHDIRVIIIMIVQNLVLMRSINHHPDDSWVRNVAFEANYLYAQLAHRLGLYKIKGELEDLSLKYTNREIYTQIAHKLNATKRSRDQYIAEFIAPFRKRLEKEDFKFEIKGRTKSISSIWNKMKKQKVDLPGIYDLFAIRVIIDTPEENEKTDCWKAYAILTDMYTANPARMKDWITVPKSNGYESLHGTVMGPGNKWVEVQFRTRRMDLVAEKGLAAHWRYKGVKGDSTDQWMANIRDILDAGEAGPMQLMRNINMDPFGKEVFAFTPKGDLFRLSAGATVLDFAFHVHTNVGARCTGAIVNGRNCKLNYRIQNGDTVEILTSANQEPRLEWLQIVNSVRARNKIKQCLNEQKQRLADLGKEALMRRAKNRKIDVDEATLMKLIKKQGYKYALEFFADMGRDKIDPGRFLNTYVDEVNREHEVEKTSAEEYKIVSKDSGEPANDVLTIGEKSINGLKYKFARCCNPIYGDKVFGFITSDGTVTIHKTDCPNAPNIRIRYPYRLIDAEWSGKTGNALPATIRVIGIDDIGIVANITGIISHEQGCQLRNISIDSNDGMFQGFLVVTVSDTRQLTALIKKIKTVKGVKDAVRM